MAMARTSRIFWDRHLDQVLANAVQQVKTRIDKEDPNYLLNVNEADYIAHLVGEFHVAPLVIDFERVEVSFSEKMIPAERFPPTFSVFAGKAYAKQVVRYHIPFSGDAMLLQCVPNPRVVNTITVDY